MNRTLILVGLLSSAFFVALAPCAVANTAWYVDGVNGVTLTIARQNSGLL